MKLNKIKSWKEVIFKDFPDNENLKHISNKVMTLYEFLKRRRKILKQKLP